MKLDVPITPEDEWYVVWQSADYTPSDAPLYVNEWPLLLRQAESSLDSRRWTYPAWIERGQISREAAEADIRAWEWLAAEWQWIVTGEGELPPVGSLPLRRAAVKLSLERIDAELRRGHRTHAIFRQAHIAMALAWHLDRIRDGEPEIHAVARFNHHLRREGMGHLELLCA